MTSKTIRLADHLDASGKAGHGIAAVIRKLVQAASPGDVVDARDLGTVLLESDPFDGIADAPVELITGKSVFHLDFNRNFITLPSRLTWRMEGTQIRPVQPITRIATDASPATGMIATAISGGYCSVGKGQDTIIVDDASGLQVGARIAILGTKLDQSVMFHLTRPIAAGQTGALPLAGDVEATISNSRVYLVIDEETVLVAVKDGQADILQRGALGSEPAEHSLGSPVVLARSTIAIIAGIQGKAIRLETSIPRAARQAIFKAGAVDVSLLGDGLIDGGYTSGPAEIYSALASTLSTRFSCAGELRLAHTSHGGLFLFGSAHANVQIASISDIGRPVNQLGAGVWLFGETVSSTITADKIENGNLGLAIDNKSYGVSYFGLDGVGHDNHVAIGAVLNQLTGVQITAGTDNQVQIGYLETSKMDVIIDPDARQSIRTIRAKDNIVVIERQNQRRPDSIEFGNQVTRY